MNLRTRRRSVAVALMVVLGIPCLQGCESLGALSFKKADSSGIEDPQIVRLYYLRGTSGDNQFKLLDEGEIYDELRGALNECAAAKIGLVPLIPLIAAGGTLVFGWLTDALASEVKRVRESGKRSYEGATLTDANAYDDGSTECLFLVRYGEQSPAAAMMQDSGGSKEVPVHGIKDIGLAALFVEDSYGGGKAWRLSFLMMSNALAVTAPGDPAKVDVSLALASKAVAMDKEKKSLATFPFDTMTIKGVPIDGKTPAVNCAKRSDESERNCVYSTALFVVPEQSPQTKGGAWFSVGVTETGSVAASFDDAAAELEALKKALGPAIGESIKIWLTPEEP